MEYIGKITDRVWGEIPVRCSSRAKRVIFKAVSGSLHIVVPACKRFDEQLLLQFVDDNREALRKMLERTASRMARPRLYSGLVITTEEGEIHLLCDDVLERNCVRSLRQGNILYVYFSAANDITEPRYERFVSQFIVGRMRAMWGDALCDMVRHYAQQFALNVADVRVGKGRRVLGHCSSRGVVTVSAYVLFYPPHLRRYIVCHELAHLTHFNHSSDFHRLCDAYCGGNEQQWRKESHDFVFPIV